MRNVFLAAFCVAMLPAGIAGADAAGDAAGAAADADPVLRGAYIARIGGCHDCHTPGFSEQGGEAPAEALLIGVPVGLSGPWGTTYAANLRLVAAGMDEDAWVRKLSTLEARPPMPWFNVRILPESDMRALYRYITSLGEPGAAMPEYLPPGEEPATPYLVYAPPTMPGQN